MRLATAHHRSHVLGPRAARAARAAGPGVAYVTGARTAGLTAARSARRAGGFSFTEVLFAVMILGIGFIMVAAIFPVAIQQARTSTEETTGAAVSRGGANYLEKIASNSTMPATDDVVVSAEYNADAPDEITIASAVGGSLVVPADGRVAWVPFYRRAGTPGEHTLAPGWAPFAQVFMIPVHVRGHSAYVNAGGFDTPTPVMFNRGGSAKVHGTASIRVDLANGVAGAPVTLTFRTPADAGVASEGAYVIIADARRAPPTDPWNTAVAPRVQGRIYRLGNPVTPSGGGPATVWELMPGFEYEALWFDLDGNPATPAAGRDHDRDPATPNVRDGRELEVTTLTNVAVFIVGRGHAQAQGPAQEVSAYTTFVNVN